MRKNYIHLVLLLLLNVSMFGQKVTISPTLINGMGYSGGSINLGSLPTTTVSLSVKVDVPSSAAAGNQGTIKIYFSRGTALGSNVTNGGDGGALYFGGGNVATRSFVIELNWSDFLTSGGFIYAEYNNGTAYKSSNITVIKNSTVNTGTNLNPPKDAPNPKNIANTICCDQTIRLGEKPEQITGSQYLNPYDTLPYGIASVWETTARSPIIFDNINKTLTIDYITEPGDITIKRNLGYYHNFEPVNKSNTIKIKVLPSPILTNTITTNDVSNSDGYYELSNVKTLNLYGFSSKVNLNMLQDPSHINQRGDNITDVDSYRWEYKNNKLASNPWITIPNEIYGYLNFSDPSQLSNTEDTNYLIRRIAIYKNVSRVSNEINVLVRGLRFNNTICCDQILKIETPTNFEDPQTIIGSTVIVDKPIREGQNFKIKSITYQWQSQSTTGVYPTSIWSDISDAKSKDYLPSQPLKVVFNTRGGYAFESSYKYRRVVTINYSVVTTKLINGTATSYSNETYLNGAASTPYIKVYPNPTSSILTIECTVDISDAKVIIHNIMGTIVNSNDFSVLDPRSISIDVSNFIAGTYFITIENEHLGTIQRAFIKQ